MAEVPGSLRAALGARYRLERVLGQGGMATVYLAHDLRHERPVAIKVLRPDIGVLLGRDRFEREIRRTAQLSHPGIIPVFDSGEAAGYLYYVMPVLPGESLKDRLAREHRLGLTTTCQLLAQVAAALDHAHAQGLVHRDVKPANILLHGEQAIVADFGVAMATSEVPEARLTETGLSVGTPTYMSPEQAVGERELDGRSDQYSLACVAFELIGGDPPFTGSTPQAVIARQIADLPPSLATVRPDLPPAAEAALRRALSKVPGDRFASVGEFVAALAAGTTAEAPAISGGSAGPRRPARRRRLATAALLGLTVLGAGLWRWGGALRGEGEVIRSIAVLPPEDLSRDTASAYLVAGLHEGLITELGQLPDVRVKPRSAVLSLWGKGRSIPDVVEGLAVDGVVELAILPAGPNLRITAKLVRGRNLDVLWANTYNGSREDILRTVSELARALATESGLDVHATLGRLTAARRVNPDAYRLVVLSREVDPWTEEGSEKALRYLSEARLADPLYAPAYARLAQVLRIQLLLGYVRPSEYGPQALQAARKAVELDSLDGENHLALAEVEFWVNWDRAAAERAYTRANQLNPSLSGANFAHSTYLVMTGRFDAAIAELERIVRNDPQNPRTLDFIWANFNARRYAEALRFGRGDTAKVVLQQVGWTYIMMDSVPQALEATRRSFPEPGERADGFTFSTAATVYALAGQPAEARRLLDSTFAWARATRKPLDPYQVAVAYAALGEDDEAIRYFERALAERWPSMMFAAVEPWIPDRLRVHPRMRAIFKAAGLPAWAGEPFDPQRVP